MNTEINYKKSVKPAGLSGPSASSAANPSGSSQYVVRELDSQNSLSLDWVQGSISNSKFDDFVKYLQQFLQCKPIAYDYGRFTYNRSLKFEPYNVAIYFDGDHGRAAELHRDRFMVVFCGSDLAQFEGKIIYKLVQDLTHKFWFKCSRLDVAFDDAKKIIHPQKLNEHAQKGNYTGFRKHKYVAEMSQKGVLRGSTLYFGTRGKSGGGRFLRVYDKALESNGEIDSIRWEVEFSKDKAKSAFFQLSMAPDLETFTTLIGCFIGGSIDFISRRGKNLNRARRLKFWVLILKILDSVKIRTVAKKPSLEKSARFVGVTLASTISMLRKAYGDEKFFDWIGTIVSDRPLPQKHMSMINEYFLTHKAPADYGERLPF